MQADTLFENPEDFADHLYDLREKGRKHVVKFRTTGRPQRKSLSPREREEILKKTAGQCHLCGGKIEADERWQADHVFAHAHGGLHSVDNYLPAHSLCNHYRWFYAPEEFQWILKLGFWFRTQIEAKNTIALGLAQRFITYEKARARRRRPTAIAKSRAKP